MWGHQKKNEGVDAAEEVMEGEMPPSAYLLMHPEAHLKDAEKKRFIEGLQRTFGEKKRGMSDATLATQNHTAAIQTIKV